jgi:hypothetical protein
MTLIGPIQGPKNSQTYDSGLRFYTWRGTEYPSVTSVRSLAGVPINLSAWYRKMTINRAIEQYDELGKKIAQDPKVASTWLWHAPDDASRGAKERGSAVHEAAAEGKAVTDVAPDVGELLIQYLKWLDDSHAEVLLRERQVWNVTTGYAGTFDLIARFPKSGEVHLIDLKTGAGTYPEHAMQCEAYRQGEFVGNDDKVDRAATDILQSVTGTAILHLQPGGWSYKIIDPKARPALWDAFTGLLDFAWWVHKNPTIDSMISRTLGTMP